MKNLPQRVTQTYEFGGAPQGGPPGGPPPPPQPAGAQVVPGQEKGNDPNEGAMEDLKRSVKRYKNHVREQKKVIEEVDRLLRCAICFEIFHRPVTLPDCQHTFCGSCLFQSLQQREACPHCRTEVYPDRQGKRAFPIDSLLEVLLSEHPDKKRTAEELRVADEIWDGEEPFDPIYEPEEETPEPRPAIGRPQPPAAPVPVANNNIDELWACPCCPGPSYRGLELTCPVQNGNHDIYRQIVENRDRTRTGVVINGHFVCEGCFCVIPVWPNFERETRFPVKCAACNKLSCQWFHERCPGLEDGRESLQTPGQWAYEKSLRLPDQHTWADSFVAQKELYAPDLSAFEAELLFYYFDTSRFRPMTISDVWEAVELGHANHPLGARPFTFVNRQIALRSARNSVRRNDSICESCFDELLPDCIFVWWQVQMTYPGALPADLQNRPNCIQGSRCLWAKNWGLKREAREPPNPFEHAHCRQYNHVYR